MRTTRTKVGGLTITYPEHHTFTVHGTPAPQGSKNVSRAGHLYEANKGHKAWRQKVEAAARAEDIQFGDKPVQVHLEFFFTTPKRPKFRLPAVKPDLDKLARSINDALSKSGMIHDDARITDQHLSKRYAETPGVRITIREAHQ